MIGKVIDRRLNNRSTRATGRSLGLTGKVVLLLGSDQNPVRQLAARLARQGADIAFAGPPLPATTARLLRTGVESEGQRFLLLEESGQASCAAESLIQSVTQQLGRLDILIDLREQEPVAKPTAHEPIARQIVPDWQLMQAALKEMVCCE